VVIANHQGKENALVAPERLLSMVETGKSRTPNTVLDLSEQIPLLLDALIALGEIAQQIKHTLTYSNHQLRGKAKLVH
jgi:hypothetical protein